MHYFSNDKQCFAFIKNTLDERFDNRATRVELFIGYCAKLGKTNRLATFYYLLFCLLLNQQ
jgi:hypothetical protein